MALGCYTPLYGDASFKGVPFEAMEVGSEHGRRGAEGEFPFGEKTAYADLGRRIRIYTIKARFVRNSHLSDSALLIAACESKGPGSLSHPTRGVVQAACKSCKVTDDVLEGQGVTYIDLEFVEANDWPAGLSLVGSILGIVADGIIADATADFVQNYNINIVSPHRRLQVLSAAAASISAIKNEYQRATVSVEDGSNQRVINEFNLMIDDPELLKDTGLVSKAIGLGIQIVGSVTEGKDKFQAMRNIANANARSSSIPGEGADVENSVYEFSRIVASAIMGQSVLEIRFGTMNEAFEYLDTFLYLITSETSLVYSACRNNTFISLRRFTVDAQNSILQKAFTLPGLVRYDFGGGVHPLSAAYSIYGDAKRHRDLENGNLINHSGRFGSTVTSASA